MDSWLWVPQDFSRVLCYLASYRGYEVNVDLPTGQIVAFTNFRNFRKKNAKWSSSFASGARTFEIVGMVQVNKEQVYKVGATTASRRLSLIGQNMVNPMGSTFPAVKLNLSQLMFPKAHWACRTKLYQQSIKVFFNCFSSKQNIKWFIFPTRTDPFATISPYVARLGGKNGYI